MKGNNDADKLSVLIADDDLPTRQMLRIFLQRHNYTVYEAKDGRQVLAFLDKSIPDVIVLDLALPLINGPHICGVIRDRRLPISILAITAYGRMNLRNLMLEAGADDFIDKPFIPDELLARMEALVQRSTTRSEPGAPRD